MSAAAMPRGKASGGKKPSRERWGRPSASGGASRGADAKERALRAECLKCYSLPVRPCARHRRRRWIARPGLVDANPGRWCGGARARVWMPSRRAPDATGRAPETPRASGRAAARARHAAVRTRGIRSVDVLTPPRRARTTDATILRDAREVPARGARVAPRRGRGARPRVARAPARRRAARAAKRSSWRRSRGVQGGIHRLSRAGPRRAAGAPRRRVYASATAEGSRDVRPLRRRADSRAGSRHNLPRCEKKAAARSRRRDSHARQGSGWGPRPESPIAFSQAYVPYRDVPRRARGRRRERSPSSRGNAGDRRTTPSLAARAAPSARTA